MQFFPIADEHVEIVAGEGSGTATSWRRRVEGGGGTAKRHDRIWYGLSLISNCKERSIYKLVQ